MPCCEIHPRVLTPQDEQKELEDPLEWLPPGELERQSQVARFYEGAAVLLTGATGFIGTLMLEKLLRSCPGVSKVYVLIRDKKGVPLRERLQAHLEKEIFRKARESCPHYLRKVVPIAGDCSQSGLGISAGDAEELAREVSVVFHVAATVRFDADLRSATLTNVGSTCEIIELVKRMPNLKAFIYMSTAYSHAPRDEIEEKFYHTELNAEELLKLVNTMEDEQMAQLLPQILGAWPNTYTLTKAIAEDVIRARAAELPVSIIRPSIVTPTYREPLALWMGNLYGPVAVGTGGAVGLLHCLHIDTSVIPDGVPADLVANATIACAWDTWRRHSMKALTQPTAEPVIYNFVSSARLPLTWGNIKTYLNQINFPSKRNIWYAYGITFKQKYLYVIGAVVCHLIPAVIADTFLYLRGMKPILWNLYSRIHGALQALEPFIMREWTFKEENFLSLLGRLGEVDNKLFPCDITEVDYEWHFTNTERGVRLYILKESFDNLETARKKYRWLTFVHFTVVTILVALLALTLWRLLAAYIGL